MAAVLLVGLEVVGVEVVEVVVVVVLEAFSSPVVDRLESLTIKVVKAAALATGMQEVLLQAQLRDSA